MLAAGIKPNVRTYTALMTAFSNAREWERARSLLRSMHAQQGHAAVEPNAYTYSALIKAMGEQVCACWKFSVALWFCIVCVAGTGYATCALHYIMLPSLSLNGDVQVWID